jgi:gamma-tubulin complex component 5
MQPHQVNTTLSLLPASYFRWRHRVTAHERRVVMAQNAKIAGLTDELIQSILRHDPAANKQAYRHAREIASRNLRGHQYARTNQFDVTARFAGLDEKFRVKNRDDLADALQTRLQRLEAYTNKYKPEFLSLLLQLADRPLENTQVEALELLRPPSPPPPLTWAEILKDDPYSDEDIWKDIDYDVDSSGDEKTPKKRRKAPSTPPTSFDADDTFDPEACVSSTEQNLVTQLEDAQFWSSVTDGGSGSVGITELQAVRETLFMLGGLKTSLYQTDNDKISPNETYTVDNNQSTAITHLLSQFADTGTRIEAIRRWTLQQRAKKPPASPLIKTFEAAVRKRLLHFDRSLSAMQQRYLLPDAPLPVSLLPLHGDVRELCLPILRLVPIVNDLNRSTADAGSPVLVNPFHHLEALYEQTTLAQMTLEDEIFTYMSEIFFECLQTYLKPIRRWMETGELGPDEENFFVISSDAMSDTTSLWHDRFMLRHDSEEHLRLPAFLQPAVKKIFNTGKSVIFLKELGIYDPNMHSSVAEPRLDHETVCHTADDVPLSPFPELFQTAFETWIRSKYSVASSVLRQHIFETDGLMRVLHTFENLYLGRNGAVFEDFATVIFERMDAGRRGWNDRYVLTELARGIFGTILAASDTEKLVVRSTKVKTQGSSIKGLAAVSVDYAVCIEPPVFCVLANDLCRYLGLFKTSSSARPYPSIKKSVHS